MPKFKHPISPMTRLTFAFDAELKRDETGVLHGLKERYFERLAVAEHKRDSVFRSLFIIDAALAFLISGSNFKLPLLELKTSEIPAVIETATTASAIALVFAVFAFTNWAAYDTISRQYGVSHAQRSTADPDFINAAESHVELTLKLLRTKFNIWGPDLHEPGWGFKLYSWLVSVLISALFVLFPIVHFLLTALSLASTYLVNGLGLISSVYFLIIIILNLLAVLVFRGVYQDFNFSTDIPDNASNNKDSA